MKKKGNTGLVIECIIIVVIFICLIGWSVGGTVIRYMNDTTTTITVTDKGNKKSDNDDKYLVWGTTRNGETIVFENTDLLFKGKFNSSDIQGNIAIGETYEVKTVGYRIPFFSMYQNIYEVTEIK